MPGLDTASRVYPTCGAPPTVSKHVPPSHELDVLPGEPPENVYLQHQILGWKGAQLELEQTQLENKRDPGSTDFAAVAMAKRVCGETHRFDPTGLS